MLGSVWCTTAGCCCQVRSAWWRQDCSNHSNLEILFPVKQTKAQRHKHVSGPSDYFCPHSPTWDSGRGGSRDSWSSSERARDRRNLPWVSLCSSLRGSRTQSSRKACGEDLEAVLKLWTTSTLKRERGNKSRKERGCNLYYIILCARVHRRTAWFKGGAWKRICLTRAGQGIFLS